MEAQLDHLDQVRSDEEERDEASRTELDRGAFDPVEDAFGFHVDGPDDLPTGTVALDDDTDGLPTHVDEGTVVAVLDELVVAFNHRDLEDLLEVIAADGEAPGLLGYDRDNLPDAVTDLWVRRPTVQLTRGTVDDSAVGVLWEHDGSAWWRLAAVCIDDVHDGVVGVVEFADDPELLERVEASEPDDDLLEGERWQEWDEGTDG